MFLEVHSRLVEARLIFPRDHLVTDQDAGVHRRQVLKEGELLLSVEKHVSSRVELSMPSILGAKCRVQRKAGEVNHG